MDQLHANPFWYEGGVVVSFGSRYARFRDGTWVSWSAPDGARYRGPAADGTLLFVVYAGTGDAVLATFDPESSVWTARPDCGRTLTFGTAVVLAAGRTWAVDLGGSDSGRLPLPYVELGL